MNSNTFRHAERVIIDNVQDHKGTMLRTVELTSDGGLMIAGHDLGRASRTSSVTASTRSNGDCRHRRLCASVSCWTSPPMPPLLPTIKVRFAHAAELEQLLMDNEIAGEFWNRIGD